MRFVWTTILLLSAISLYVNAQTTAIVEERPGERVFAIDDIDERWAVLQVTFMDTVCVGTKTIFAAHFENNNYLQEPIVYQWLFSSDSLNWEPVPEGEKTELKLKALPHHSGWYRMMISGMNTDGTNQLHRE